MNDLDHKQTSSTYEIVLKGHLSSSWTNWFEGMTFRHEQDGTTVLIGEVIDQAALHGMLKKVRDLGLSLISVNNIDPDHL